MDAVRAYLDTVWSLAAAMGEVTAESVRRRFDETIWSRVELGPEVGLKQGYDEQKIKSMKAVVRPTMVEYAKGDRKADSITQVAANKLIPTQGGVKTTIVLDYVKNGHPKFPVVVHYKGEYFIWDGHHRTISDVISGKTPTVNVVEL